MRHMSTVRLIISLSLCCFLYLGMLPVITSGPAFPSAAGQTDVQEPQIPVIAPGSAYRQTNFVSDWPGVGLIQGSASGQSLGRYLQRYEPILGG